MFAFTWLLYGLTANPVGVLVWPTGGAWVSLILMAGLLLSSAALVLERHESRASTRFSPCRGGHFVHSDTPLQTAA